MYRSGVGTLLYLAKHSRPDTTNPMRELFKSTDGVSMAQVTEMYSVINFVLKMKTLGLRMMPVFNDGIWKLEANRSLAYGTLLGVLWQMFHAWITYVTVRRIA